MRQVGTVVGLWRYPVKAMAGEKLDAADVGWQGIDGDRRWAFVRDGNRTGFPWLTIRQRPELVTYRATVDGAIVAPGGTRYDVTDPALAEELEPGARLVKLDRGAFDSAPLSLLSTHDVGDWDVRRFRPNIVVDGTVEVGATVRIGTAAIRIDRPDRRCVVVTVDPDTGAKDPSVLRDIARNRNNEFGVYASPVTPGRIAVGDPVQLVTPPG